MGSSSQRGLVIWRPCFKMSLTPPPPPDSPLHIHFCCESLLEAEGMLHVSHVLLEAGLTTQVLFMNCSVLGILQEQ